MERHRRGLSPDPQSLLADIATQAAADDWQDALDEVAALEAAEASKLTLTMRLLASEGASVVLTTPSTRCTGVVASVGEGVVELEEALGRWLVPIGRICSAEGLSVRVSSAVQATEESEPGRSGSQTGAGHQRTWRFARMLREAMEDRSDVRLASPIAAGDDEGGRAGSQGRVAGSLVLVATDHLDLMTPMGRSTWPLAHLDAVFVFG